MYHPNVQAARSVQDTINYIKKDGDFLEEGTPPTSSKRNWADALLATDKAGFLTLVRDASPRDYVLFHDKVLAYADKTFAVDRPIYQHNGTLFPRLHPDLSGWQADWLDNPYEG